MPLGPSEHATMLRELDPLSYVWSYETETDVASGAAGAANDTAAAERRVTRREEHFMIV